MSPDDDVLVPFAGLPRDPHLAALDAELELAAERMRRAHARDGRDRPSSAFGGSLRARLLAEAAVPVAPVLAAPHAETYDRAPSHVASRVARRTPTVLPAPRWSILAVAAVLVASVLGLNVERFFPAPAPSRVSESVGATLHRGGTTIALAQGTELRAGDVVAVGAGGRATLALGGSAVRLAEGSAVRLDALAGGIAMEQLAGRAWHRVDVAPGQTYAVTTGTLRWTALGTAFDVAWQADGRRVRILTVEHAVALAGPGLELRVPEGRAAIVDAHGDAADVAVDGVGSVETRDPWLVANARLDAADGHGVGWLTTALADPTTRPSPRPAATPAPGTLEPTAAPSTEPSFEPPPTEAIGTPGPTPAATPRPTARPTPKPTPKPTVAPTPTASPGLASLSLDAVACHGAVLLSWTGDPGPAFHHWTALRAGSSFAVPASYPPPDGISALDGSYSKNPAASRFADTSLAAGATAWYRAVGWSADDRSVAASAAVSVTGKSVASLGPTGATPKQGGAQLTWAAYGGPGACFTYYKISWSATSEDPSYLGDNDGSTAVSGQGETAAAVALPAGTHWIRVEAILATDFGKAVVGRSTPVQVTVSP